MAIHAPEYVSEFEVQAFIYWKLKELGLNVRGEVKVPFDNSSELVKYRRAQSRGQAYCRFDLAIFENNALVEVIEVKTAQSKYYRGPGWTATRQGRRYRSFGVPVTIVHGMKAAEALVEAHRRRAGAV